VSAAEPRWTSNGPAPNVRTGAHAPALHKGCVELRSIRGGRSATEGSQGHGGKHMWRAERTGESGQPRVCGMIAPR
jgi:hypothetical protein